MSAATDRSGTTGSTTAERFAALIPGHRVFPVIRELFADGETPVGIYRKLAAGQPGSFLLESAEQGGIWSRFSFVGVSSFGVLTQQGDRSCWVDYGLSEERALGDAATLGPLAALAHLYARWQTPHVPGHSPAHRRSRRLHRLGGGAPDRAAAQRAAGRLRACRARRSASSPSSSCSTTSTAPCC